jgi:enoyl-CoA hydratase/carnithine racemase
MTDNVHLDRDGALATVTLSRPERRNSLSDAMLTDLGRVVTELRDDAAVRIVILTGAPPVFSAGADAGLKSSMSAEERRHAMATRKSQFRRLFERVNTMLEGLEQLTICAVNGHAIGGGWGLTLACDFRLAATDAQFWIPEVDLGVPLGVASTTRFVRFVGPARAKEIILECRRYSAEEARVLGLVNRVVPGNDLMKYTREYAQDLLAKPFRALSEMKARVNAIARTAVPEVNAMTEGFLQRD